MSRTSRKRIPHPHDGRSYHIQNRCINILNSTGYVRHKPV